MKNMRATALLIHKIKGNREMEKIMVAEKRWLREECRRTEETDRRIVHTYGNGYDGYIERIIFPEWVQTREEAEEYFDGTERMTFMWTPYDCSGQWFTSWHRLFKVNGRWICYHSVDCDV